MQDRRLAVNPESYKPLLELIGKAESKGNYNAHFGNASNTSVDFTKMSITEVMNWQKKFVQEGNLSSAVGKYQIIDDTLADLVSQLDIDKNKKFDQSMQDTLAIALLERRGGTDYVNKKLTADQFAGNLAKEWAGLPKVIGENPHDSYYASDGINKSLVTVDEVLKAIEPIKSK